MASAAESDRPMLNMASTPACSCADVVAKAIFSDFLLMETAKSSHLMYILIRGLAFVDKPTSLPLWDELFR